MSRAHSPAFDNFRSASLLRVRVHPCCPIALGPISSASLRTFAKIGGSRVRARLEVTTLTTSARLRWPDTRASMLPDRGRPNFVRITTNIREDWRLARPCDAPARMRSAQRPRVVPLLLPPALLPAPLLPPLPLDALPAPLPAFLLPLLPRVA